MLADFAFLKISSLALGQSYASQWSHNKRDGVSNNQPRVCLLNRWNNAGEYE